MLIRSLLLLTLSLPLLAAASIMKPLELADLIATQHGLDNWLKHKALHAHVVVKFGGKTAIDHDFTFAINGAEARMDGSDGTSVIYDGRDAWLSPSSAELNKGRFHVLTWPWFIRAPFTVKYPWQELGPVSTFTDQTAKRHLSRQTFKSGTGDTPDDWYGLLVNPDNGQLESMQYIVTYGKELETANKSISQIDYHDYVDIDGCKISTRWTLWHLDPETLERKGEAKASGSVSNIRFVNPSADTFKKPANAQLLAPPK